MGGCPRCQSASVVRNGHAHTGRQRWLCKSCGYQFTIGRRRRRTRSPRLTPVTHPDQPIAPINPGDASRVNAQATQGKTPVAWGHRGNLGLWGD